MYAFLGIVLYFFGNMYIFYRMCKKVSDFFIINPNGLPKELPSDIEEFKQIVGEEAFDELYKKYQDGNFDK